MRVEEVFELSGALLDQRTPCPGVHGLILHANGRVLKLYTQKEDVALEWIQTLRTACVTFDFRERFEVLSTVKECCGVKLSEAVKRHHPSKNEDSQTLSLVKTFPKALASKNRYLRSHLEREVELFHLDRHMSGVEEVSETAESVHLIYAPTANTHLHAFTEAFLKSLDPDAFFKAQLEESEDSCDSDSDVEEESQEQIRQRLSKVAEFLKKHRMQPSLGCNRNRHSLLGLGGSRQREQPAKVAPRHHAKSPQKGTIEGELTACSLSSTPDKTDLLTNR